MIVGNHAGTTFEPERALSQSAGNAEHARDDNSCQPVVACMHVARTFVSNCFAMYNMACTYVAHVCVQHTSRPCDCVLPS